MNKTLRFTLTAAWAILSRGYDAYCTAQYTPDLSHEANPLVSVFGMGWTPLLLIIGGLTLYTVYAYYLREFKPMDLNPPETSFSISEFAGFEYLGTRSPWYAAFYRIPGDLNRFNQYMGKYMMPCLVFAGVVSTIMWLLINFTEDYMPSYHNAKIIYGILLIGVAGIIFSKTKRSFKRYVELGLTS